MNNLAREASLSCCSLSSCDGIKKNTNEKNGFLNLAILSWISKIPGFLARNWFLYTDSTCHAWYFHNGVFFFLWMLPLNRLCGEISLVFQIFPGVPGKVRKCAKWQNSKTNYLGNFLRKMLCDTGVPCSLYVRTSPVLMSYKWKYWICNVY